MSTDTGGHVHPQVAGLIDTELQKQATEWEIAHTERQAVIDKERARKSRRVQIQFWFLFGFLVAAFLLLAYRTEMNAQALQDAQAVGCDRRAATAVTFNEGRTALINLVANTPSSTSLTAQEKAQMIQTLKDGLILPVEDCSGYVRNN